MFSRVSLIERKSGLSKEAFLAHWRKVHGRLTVRLPGLKACYHHRIDDIRRNDLQEEEAWTPDGVEEQHFHDLDSMRAALSSSEYARIVEDSCWFLSGIRSLICASHTLVPTVKCDGPKTRILSLLRRNPDLSPKDFRREWQVCNTKIIAQRPDILGFRQHLVVERHSTFCGTDSYDGAPIDGVADVLLNSSDAADDYLRELNEVHGKGFLAGSSTCFVETAKVGGKAAVAA